MATCEFCRTWVAKNWKQFNNRARAMNTYWEVEIVPCPRCGRKDWATQPPDEPVDCEVELFRERKYE